MKKYYFIILFSLFSNEFGNVNSESSDDDTYDTLVFSQQWPNTECSDWKKKNSSNTCNLPKNPNDFIVHGYWPMKKGTNGPSYCDKNAKFNQSEIEPIIQDLKEHWTNLHEDSDSFWEFEWKKHGTCAKDQYSIKEYFQTALDLNQKYKIKDVLEKAGIKPGEKKYKSDDIVNVITKAYGKDPKVTCKTISDNVTLLNEVRLCFDKSLTLMDCTDAGLNEVSCDNENSIQYPDKVV